MTSTENSISIQSKLNELADNYASQLPGKIEAIKNHWFNITNAGMFLQDDLEQLKFISHSIAGSGATFGFLEISKISRNLELLTGTLGIGNKISNEENLQIEKLIDQLDSSVIQKKYCNPTFQFSDKPDSLKSTSTNRRILLIEDDQILASSLIEEIKTNKYDVVHLDTIKNLQEQVQTIQPAVIIADVMLPEGEMAGLTAIQSLRDNGCFIPVIVISVRDDIDARLMASRTGATEYMAKPLRIKDLVYTLDKLTEKSPQIPYRVLIIDDDKPLCEFYSIILQQAGMDTRFITDPMRALDEVNNFDPELILLDLYMPGCSGIDVASVIRQFRRYDTVPIIFLSRESDLGRQMEALELGGDDFLTKPIAPDQLLLTVNARVKRGRQLFEHRRRLESTIRELERQKFAIDQHAIVSITDVFGNIVYANEKFSQISGYSQQELLGQTHRIINSGYHPKEFFEDMWNTIKSGRVWQGEVRNKSKDNRLYWVNTTIVPFLDTDGVPYQFASIRTDITQQIEAKEHANNANQAKSEFLSGMSHELRTPLNAILGFSQLMELEDDPVLSDAQLQHLNEITKAGHHLLNLINEILDLARIEAGKTEFELEQVAMSGIINDCITLITPLADKKNISINIVEPEKFPVFNVDRTRIKQIMLNFLSNAVKYNHDHGSVTISPLYSGNRCRICVADNGFGIPGEKQVEMFQAFNRIGQKDIEGTGIGLVITKRLVEQMGGNIGFDSLEGKGSTFWCEFDFHGDIKEKDGSNETVVNQAENTTGINKNICVLYIEDNSANIRLMEGILKRKPDVTLTCITEPLEGLSVAENIQPDIILLDINLPEINGYELCKRMRENKKLVNVPIIAISANVMPDDIKKGQNSGFSDYLTKPVNVQKLFSVIDDIAGKNRGHECQQN